MQKPKCRTFRWDNQFLYVGSNGMPDHPMMIGIRSWQQQVPIPQQYFGDNAWRIPLRPVPAKQPMSTKNDFLRGAIASALDGHHATHQDLARRPLPTFLRCHTRTNLLRAIDGITLGEATLEFLYER